MGNSHDIYFGRSRSDEPEEYGELISTFQRFDTEEEKTLLKEVRAAIKPEWHAANPELCDFMALACLRYRRHDVNRAIERMNNYFTWRIKTMGDLKEQDVTSGSTLDRLFKLNVVKLLPETSHRGQSMMYVRLRYARPDLFCAKDMVQMAHYVILEGLKRNPISQVMGVISFGDMEGAGTAQLDKEVPKQMIGMLSKHLPVRLAGLMLCHPNFLVSIIVPIAKLFMSTKMASRLKIVGDTTQLCEYYGLSKEVLPTELGGMFVVKNDGIPFCSTK